MKNVEFNTPISAEEALVACKGDWEVALTETLHPIQKINSEEMEPTGRCVIHRKPLQVDRILGHCSTGYKPMQNIDFAQRIDSLFDGGKARIVRAGSTGHGRRPFMIADCGDASIGGNDPISNLLLFGTSHDGTSSMKAVPIVERSFCTNKLTYLFSKSVISVPHRQNMNERLDEAKDALTGLTKWHEEFQDIAERMAVTAISNREFHEWANRLYIKKANKTTKRLLTSQANEIDACDLDKQERAHRKREKFVDSVGLIWASCDDENSIPETKVTGFIQPEYRGTNWHALNALTHYVDHMASFSDQSVLSGRGASIKYEAYNQLSLIGG